MEREWRDLSATRDGAQQTLLARSIGPKALPSAGHGYVRWEQAPFFPLYPFPLQQGVLKTDLLTRVCFKLIISEVPWLLNLTTGPMTLVSLQHPGAFQPL